jgi:hypothetical protein
MSARKMRHTIVAVSLGLSVCMTVEAAQAYNWRTHSRMAEVAAELMLSAHNAGAGGLTPPPGLSDPNHQWAAFVTAAGGAYTALLALQTGVANPGAENAVACGYESANPTGRTENMNEIPKERIEDMNFLPIKGGNVPLGSPVNNMDTGDLEPLGTKSCSEVSSLCCDSKTHDSNLTLGRVLGWQAASVDDHEQDSVIFTKPSSSAYLSLLGDLVSLATGDPLPVVGLVGGVVVGIVGGVVIGLICIGDAVLDDIFGVKGDSTCSHDVQNFGKDLEPFLDLSTEQDPVGALAEDAIPGFGDQVSYKYVGLWHFIDVVPIQGGKQDYYNAASFPGILYDQAGPTGSPGADDTSIQALADFNGWTIDATQSQGVPNYGNLDQRSRGTSDWEQSSFAHIEFSPVDNLAQFGWNDFTMKANSDSAFFLGWPLHALGDSAEPQHVAGTTAWGHRPYEDEVDNLLDSQLLPPPPSGCPATCSNGQEPLVAAGAQDSATPTLSPTSPQANRILADAFNFWTQIQSQFGKGKLPIRQLVQSLAQQTFALASAAPGTTVYNDEASTDWAGPYEDLPGNNSTIQQADAEYAGSGPQMMPMIELGTGAIMAFLVGAAQTATLAPQDTNQFCNSPSMPYDPTTQSCNAAFLSQDGGIPVTATGLCTPPCAEAGGGGECLPCQTSADCEGTGMNSCNFGCCSGSIP